uniref:Uncharacterized protein n=1 Tax=Tanacetum cinerariifolium TaxID=118510 RepID=A0A6L2MPT5_TANCI|nr:hypothetical protein [Tanacetum cinerariifolium]
MLNTNNNLQTQTSNDLHNAIMEAGGKDRPPMLAPGNYVQWKSRIKRYIDTKPNNELIHYCLQNPSYKFKWAERTIPVAEGSLKTTIEGYMENYKNVSQDIRNQLDAKAKDVQITLTWIDNYIYSTLDACPNAREMWKAIERLKQAKECKKLKWVKDAAYHKEKMLLYKQTEAIFQLNAEQADWRDDTDDEPEDQQLEVHYLHMAHIQAVTPDVVDNSGPIFNAEPLQKVQNDNDKYNVFADDDEHPEHPESVNDTYPDKQGDTNIPTDSLDMSNNGGHADQDDDDDLAREHLKKFQAELDRYHDVNYASKVELIKQKIKLVEIILLIVDSGYSKNMMGNLNLLSNFVEKFFGTVKFGNDQIAPILSYGDLVQGNVTIKRVYYIEGLNHNLFFVDLYSITLQDTSTPNLICLIAKASSSQAWLWHLRLSHLKFNTINLLLKYAIVTSLPKLKFVKDHLCSSCELRKAKHSENLDKMKEKGDACIFVGYSTQSRAYRVYNKRSRVIVETIHVNFDELPQMASDHVSSYPVPQCTTTALEECSLSPSPLSQENVPKVAETVTTSNELDLLFSLMFDELLNGTT